MDDRKTRTIEQETLDRVLRSLNKDFVNDLPIPPNDLLEFAKRRTNPFISDNISHSLGKSMLSHRLSDEDYLVTFFKVVNYVFSNKSPVGSSNAEILVSQTGAGKTRLRQLLLNRNKNTLVINSDLYKKFRPDVDQILKENPNYFGALTGIDSYDHASNITDLAATKSYNLLLECAPSNKQGLVGIDMDTLTKRDYSIKYHVLAVGDLISLLSIHSRYEDDIRDTGKKGEAKLTDIKRHDESYKGVENVLTELPTRCVSIYRRGTQQENQIPQMLTKNNFEESSYSSEELLKILKIERNNSNYNYIFDSIGKGFREDFNQIKRKMEDRHALEEQMEQLKSIYSKYVNYSDNIMER